MAGGYVDCRDITGGLGMILTREEAELIAVAFIRSEHDDCYDAEDHAVIAHFFHKAGFGSWEEVAKAAIKRYIKEAGL